MEEKETFGKFIVQKRKAKNLTQKELAQQLYVTESAVSKWERGVSYPDISLVSSLCEILGVSEHELITCSEDFQLKETERQAKYFRRIMKTYSLFFYICYGISLFVCFVVNLVLEQRLTWFFLVFTGEMVAFSITSLPNLIKSEYRRWIVIGSTYLSVNLLLLVSCLYTDGDWFFITAICLFFGVMCLCLPFLLRDLPLPSEVYQHKTFIYFTIITVILLFVVTVAMSYGGYQMDLITIGLPLTLLCALPFWLMMIVIRYIKINSLWKVALCLLILAVFEFFINSFMMMIIHHQGFVLSPINLSNWSEPYIDGNIKLIVAGILFLVAIFFTIGGISLEIKKKTTDNL